MWASMDTDGNDVKAELTTDAAGKPRIRISYEQVAIRLDVAEAVDLVDVIVAELAKLEPGDAA
jgi:hypothetical protein